jgi:ABC-type Fe3+-hydroxamate transport system substrate-binding protein
MTVKDQLNRALSFNETPRRIVSLVPSQTELLYDLGLEESIVGITKFCVHPRHLKATKKVVGGTKKVNLEKIKALAPDIILCNKEENTLAMVAALEPIALVHVSDILTIQDTAALITQYGILFSCRTAANALLAKINFQVSDFKDYIAGQPRLKVAYFIWRKPWMVAAENTFIQHMLDLNGFDNIYANKTRYPEVELKRIRLEGDPELILFSSEPYPFKEEHAFEVGRFTHHAKVVFVDGEMFSWYGSRLVKAFDYFKKLRTRLGN